MIGLAATWNALPRKPLIANATRAFYADAVRDFLKSRGIDHPQVRITRILRGDLDRDGQEEVLISATNYFTEDKSDHSAAPFPEAPHSRSAGWKLFHLHLAARSRRECSNETFSG